MQETGEEGTEPATYAEAAKKALNKDEVEKTQTEKAEKDAAKKAAEEEDKKKKGTTSGIADVEM